MHKIKAGLNLFVISVFLGLIILCFQGCGPKVAIKPEAFEMDEDLFSKAEQSYAMGKLDTALTQYKAYIEQHPHSPLAPGALMKMGKIYRSMGNYANARNRYEKILEKYPDTVFVSDAAIEILDILFVEGKYPELIQQVSRVPREKFNRIQLVRIAILTGDSFLALGLQLDAAYSFVVGCGNATETEKEILQKKIKSALIGVDEEQLQALIGRLADPSDVDLVVKLHRMGLFRKDAVGCLLPLSGQYEVFGQRAQRGIELALYHYSLAGGSPLKIIIKDTRSDSAVAANRVQELFDEQVSCIIGPVAVPLSAVKKAQALGIPIIALSQKDGIPETGDYVFRNFLTSRMQVASLVSHAVENLGACRFAILYPKENYGTSFMNLFLDEVEKHDGEVVGAESYEPGQTDFADPIKKLVGTYGNIPYNVRLAMLIAANKARHLKKVKAPISDGVQIHDGMDDAESDAAIGNDLEDSLYGENGEPRPIIGFDVLFIPDSPKMAGLIIPQLAYYDVENVTLLGTNLWHSDKLIKMAASYAQGAVITEGFFGQSDSMPVEAFVSSFKEVYESSPGFFEAVSYDTAVLLFEILTDPNLETREDIRDSLLEMPYYDGVTGLTAFYENGEAEKKLYLLKLKGNRFVEIIP